MVRCMQAMSTDGFIRTEAVDEDNITAQTNKSLSPLLSCGATADPVCPQAGEEGSRGTNQSSVSATQSCHYRLQQTKLPANLLPS